MDDNKIVKVAVIGVAAVVLVPVVWNAAIGVVFGTVGLVGNGINKVLFNKKIKKGLKDGSIVEINGSYYEVEVKLGESEDDNEQFLDGEEQDLNAENIEPVEEA